MTKNIFKCLVLFLMLIMFHVGLTNGNPRLGNTLALNFVCITFIMTVLLHSFATCKFVFISIFAGGFFYWFIEGFFSFFVVTKFFIVPMPTALIISVILWSIDRIPFSFSFWVIISTKLIKILSIRL